MAAADEGGLQLDLLMASLRADSGDLGSFVESLAAKLEEAIPSLVAVQRSRQGMFGPKVVRRISVDAAGERLALIADGGRDRVQAQRAKLSGGIVLKTEPVDIDSWMAALTEALATEAGKSQSTRQALERLLLD